MTIINFLVNEVLSDSNVFVGLIALIGLLLQRKKPVAVLEGTVKTIIGMVGSIPNSV